MKWNSCVTSFQTLGIPLLGVHVLVNSSIMFIISSIEILLSISIEIFWLHGNEWRSAILAHILSEIFVVYDAPCSSYLRSKSTNWFRKNIKASWFYGNEWWHRGSSQNSGCFMMHKWAWTVDIYRSGLFSNHLPDQNPFLKEEHRRTNPVPPRRGAVDRGRTPDVPGGPGQAREGRLAGNF